MPISCPSAGGRACDPRRSQPLQGPLMVPPGRGGCPAAPSGLACSQHRGQLCPCAWRGLPHGGHPSPTGGAHTYSHMSPYGDTQTYTRVLMGTHTPTSPYSQQTLPSLDTHTHKHTLPYGQQTLPAFGLSFHFILGHPKASESRLAACPHPPGRPRPPGARCLPGLITTWPPLPLPPA